VLSPEQSDRVDEILDDLSTLLSELAALMRAADAEVVQLADVVARRRRERENDR
jgi:hypothetical protein